MHSDQAMGTASRGFRPRSRFGSGDGERGSEWGGMVRWGLGFGRPGVMGEWGDRLGLCPVGLVGPMACWVEAQFGGGVSFCFLLFVLFCFTFSYFCFSVLANCLGTKLVL